MPFFELTLPGDTTVSVNTDHILYAEPNGSRTKINWVNGGHLHVQDSYDQVQARLCPTPAQTESADSGHPAKKRETK